MPRVLEVDGLVVQAPAARLHRVGAVEHDIACLRPWSRSLQQRPQPRALPLADRAPAFHASLSGIDVPFERNSGDRSAALNSCAIAARGTTAW